MCVICAVPSSDKLPLLKEFKQMENANRDGAGIAWIDKKKNCVRWHKGLDATELYKIALQLKGPMLIHFRFGTIGGKVKELTHPFPITRFAQNDLTGSAGAVLTHNGHWSNWSDVLKAVARRTNCKKPEGLWSDSRAIAWIANQIGRRSLDCVGEKICVLTQKGFEYYGRGWEKSNGCWFSNTYWKPMIVNYPVSNWNDIPKDIGASQSKEDIARAIRNWNENHAVNSQETFNYHYNGMDEFGLDNPINSALVVHSEDD